MPTNNGPDASVNNCERFTFGIRTNPNMGLFPNRAIGLNTFQNVTTPYTAGLAKR